ncbi:CARDB domain-containing protein [Kineococcus terrestris]|uniref:CARDB domain-containing protein n=1 Tax=Kineococcus terrestris TaxID=2044856 RepID=UPI0034DB29AE
MSTLQSRTSARTSTRTTRRTRALAAAAGALVAAGALAGAAPASAAGAPDLVVTAVSWGPSSPVVGAPVTFRATIANRGTAATPAGVVHGVQFKVDGVMTTWSDSSTAALAPGASRTVTANGGPAATAVWTATAGAHRITAEVDDARRIAESDERNNRRDRTLTPRTGSDTVSSEVVVTGTGTDRWVSVRSTLGPSTRPSYVSSRLSGTLSAACYDARGTAVAGTVRDLGRVAIGDTAAGPFRSSPDAVYAVADAHRAPVTVSADVVLRAILRDRAGDLAGLGCAGGTTAGFARWDVDSLTTQRRSLVDDAVVATATSTDRVSYAFPAPTA